MQEFKLRFNLAVNKVVGILILSDFLLFFAFGLLSPIFAIFIEKQIEGGSLKVIGLATTLYWAVRALTSVPLSRHMDRTDGERDEFHWMFWGTILLSLVPFFYVLSTKPWHIYVLQIIYGVGHTMAVPAWRIIFTNHLDKGKTGYNWSIEDVAVGLAIAVSAYIGAFLADKFGFDTLFYIVGILGLLGSFVLIPIYRETMTLREMKKLHRQKFKGPTTHP